MRAACRLAGAALALTCAPAIAGDAPGTLRVDYIHTGGPGVEVFALDEVIDLYAGPRRGE
jgi:hypothetical protein